LPPAHSHQKLSPIFPSQCGTHFAWCSKAVVKVHAIAATVDLQLQLVSRGLESKYLTLKHYSYGHWTLLQVKSVRTLYTSLDLKDL
jgi:hypothetical protein